MHIKSHAAFSNYALLVHVLYFVFWITYRDVVKTVACLLSELELAVWWNTGRSPPNNPNTSTSSTCPLSNCYFYIINNWFRTLAQVLALVNVITSRPSLSVSESHNSLYASSILFAMALYTLHKFSSNIPKKVSL